MRALLFDLDGTLTRSAGAGSRSLAKAMHLRPEAVAYLRQMRLDGMTDRAIVRLALTAGRPDATATEAEIDEVLAGYLGALEAECTAGSYTVLPGVAALLSRLSARSDVVLGLCTGNVERGARLKLGSAGLWQHFRFGGYGSDAELRAGIVRAAWSRARERGATSALIIGDTPRDIAAAHEVGLPACGVATGRFSAEELAANGAELVAASFADTDASERLLLG
jgi:phosphoglycolate phosphatase-like HAD superfamily hydrolase